MTTKKIKARQIVNLPETSLSVVQLDSKKRQYSVLYKFFSVIAFITIVLISAILIYRTAISLSKNERKYISETRVKMNPYLLVSSVKSVLAFTIVDTRDEESYTKGHIRGAILSREFKAVKGQHVIVYGYTQFDGEPEKYARQITAINIDVQVLAIGWNEFRHFTNLWVPEKDWNEFNISDYVEENL
jgi:hypothetical protein